MHRKHVADGNFVPLKKDNHLNFLVLWRNIIVLFHRGYKLIYILWN